MARILFGTLLPPLGDTQYATGQVQNYQSYYILYIPRWIRHRNENQENGEKHQETVQLTMNPV